MRQSVTSALAFAALLTVLPPLSGADVDTQLPDYAPIKEPLSGTIASVGSDTMAYVIAYWGVDFKRYYPNVKVTLEQAGSGTGPAALIEGRANVAPMSRAMNDREIDAFVKKFGYKPIGFRVGIDAVAIYVNKDNPVKGLTVAQVDAIFSTTRRCGHAQDITSWGGLGLDGDWAGREIVLFGRNSLSGTHQYFREIALCGGEYKKSVRVQEGPSEIEQALGTFRNGIGYAGVGHQLADVRPVALSRSENEPYVEPTKANALSGKYPITRFLYIYVNKAPDKPLPRLEREFIRLVLSHGGQQHMDDDGFVPLNAGVAAQERGKL